LEVIAPNEKIIWKRWSTDLDWWYTIGKHAYHEAVKSDEAYHGW
jgi:hypothetical protein